MTPLPAIHMGTLDNDWYYMLKKTMIVLETALQVKTVPVNCGGSATEDECGVCAAGTWYCRKWCL